MKLPRLTSRRPSLSSRAEFDATVDEIAELKLGLDRDIATRNQECAAEAAAFKAARKKREAEIQEKFILAEAYAAAHREELLGGKQSGESRLGLFGFRKSPGVMRKLNSKWSVGKTIEALKAAGKTACLKVTEKLDKKAVRKEIPEAELAVYGLRLEFPEDFWVEPRRSEKAPSAREKATYN